MSAPVPAVRVDRTDGTEATAIASNRRRALILCLAPGTVLGIVLGLVLLAAGQPLVAPLVLVGSVAVVTALLWRRAPAIVVRALRARPCEEWEHPRLHNLVDGLCATMGLDRPAVLVVESDVPNTMAVGRDPGSASLVVTSALDRVLGLVELEGVLAHELVHIKRHDTVLAGVAVVVTASWAVVRGTSAGVETVHRLIGPGREFSADQRAAIVVRYPPGIRSALQTMMESPTPAGGWPPGPGRVAALTRWLWVNPMAGLSPGTPSEGNLDHTRVRVAALSLD